MSEFLRLGPLQLSLTRTKKTKRDSVRSNNNLVIQEKLSVIKSNMMEDKCNVRTREDYSNCCILCVGSTGAGKSSTVGKYTGVRTKSGSGTGRVTTQCEIIRSLSDDSEPVWVDTVGWDDAECEDDETFKDILRFINQYNLTRVSAIIWNILPNVRCDALLTGQAKLINMFKEGDIWSNVLVVSKQSLNPDIDCQGAVRAAQQFTDVDILNTGYRFIDDPTVNARQRDSFRSEDARSLFNVKTDVEVKEILREKLSLMGPPVQVVFNTSTCLDCSVVGDVRLLSSFCHMSPTLVHQGELENHHPGLVEQFHPSQHQVLEHDGRLRKQWFSHFLCGTLRKPRHTCCKRRSGKEGCTKKWACCRLEWDERSSLMNMETESGCASRFRCCGASPSHVGSNGCSPRYSCCAGKLNDEGCRKVCQKCGEDWGIPTVDCFRKDHNIKEVEEETDDISEDENETVESDEELIIQEIDYHIIDVSVKKRWKEKFTYSDLSARLPQIITYHII